jgi:DNA repair protein RecO (recombination protein O)
MLARGRNLDIISGCDTIEAFAPLRASLWLTSCGLYVAELTDRLGMEGTENRKLFQLLLNTLQSLSQRVEPSTVLRYFEFRSMACSGYLPEVWRCVACGHSLEMAPHAFSPSAGGLLCPQCRPANGPSRTISVGGIKVLRFFSRHGLPAVARLRLKEGVLRELEGLMQLYVTYTIDREVNSAKWLRTLEASGEGRGE